MRDRKRAVPKKVNENKKVYKPREPKNYWDILKKENTHYTCWPGGWEIRIKMNDYGVMEVDIPRDCPRATKANFKIQRDFDKRLAQAVQTESEFRELRRRLPDEGDRKYVVENNLTGEGLVSWAYNTHTADEFDRLLRYN